VGWLMARDIKRCCLPDVFGNIASETMLKNFDERLLVLLPDDIRGLFGRFSSAAACA
jgi:hypothetical protein